MQFLVLQLKGSNKSAINEFKILLICSGMNNRGLEQDFINMDMLLMEKLLFPPEIELHSDFLSPHCIQSYFNKSKC